MDCNFLVDHLSINNLNPRVSPSPRKMTWSTEAKIAFVGLLLTCVPALFFVWKVHKRRRLRPINEGRFLLLNNDLIAEIVHLNPRPT